VSTDYESIASKLDAMAERVDGSPSITRFDVHYRAGKCEGLRIAAQTVRDIADQETESKSMVAVGAAEDIASALRRRADEERGYKHASPGDLRFADLLDRAARALMPTSDTEYQSAHTSTVDGVIYAQHPGGTGDANYRNDQSTADPAAEHQSKDPLPEPELAHARIDPAFISTVLRGLIATGDHELLATGAEGLAHRMDEIAEARSRVAEPQSRATTVADELSCIAANMRVVATNFESGKDTAGQVVQWLRDIADHADSVLDEARHTPAVDTEHQSVPREAFDDSGHGYFRDATLADFEAAIRRIARWSLYYYESDHEWEAPHPLHLAALLETGGPPHDAKILREIENKLEAVGPDLIEAIDGLISAQTECKSVSERWAVGVAQDAARRIRDNSGPLIPLILEAIREASPPVSECRSVSRTQAALLLELLGEPDEYFTDDAREAMRALAAIRDTDCGSVDGKDGER